MSVTLGFCLYKYFPFGGLQRDLVRIAESCHKRGARIRVYTFAWQGELPDWIELCLVPKKGWSSQSKNRHFTQWINEHRQTHPIDLLIGFNKMPGLDVYYAADGCYEARVTELYGDFYRLGGRYKHFSRYERDVFSSQSATQVLMISQLQIPIFKRFYQTPDERLHLLPPGIARDRIAPPNSVELRREFRREFGIADDEYLLLMVGSGFKTKGVDRALDALAALPAKQRNKTLLYVIGQDNPRGILKQAKRLGVEAQFQVFSGRDDIPRFMQGADLLIHPARHENTGTVLIEALVAGLPVLVTDVCGYAHYVKDADMGRVMASPFDGAVLAQQLSEMLAEMTESADQWRRRGAEFASQADVYSMPDVAAEKIMACAAGEL
ncbi:MAG: glucosyltransferase I RfaG [Cellvibrionaceae bacterium]|nr:glucosyltransferase I RfaG [Cellvibrionaceae bacterium]MAZ89104.1 glucosyltransferase I RfaG [Cellvibrionaceae bacterium]|tara:strand:+ start:3370 stop:4509 length:1140 start_codon:yes stop_codon:yes gene_type:complete